MSTSKLKFKTELSQLMDIIIHSLYSHREIFLRELISNASDAIDKVRFKALTEKGLIGEGEELSITIVPDAEAGTLTLIDNGIGMDRESIVENLGTIARSGTKEFLEQLAKSKESSPELIGQFGVGFYSSFMVAEEVTVRSLTAGGEAVEWSSTGEGTFTVKECDKSERGTEITLKIREDCKEYMDDYRLRDLVKRFSDFIEHPVMLTTTATSEDEDGKASSETKTEKVNSQKAIWLRAKKDVTDEEHTEFYRHISHDYNEPLAHIQYAAEGALEFKSLLYLPSKRPQDYYMAEPKPRLHLYVKRVYITDACESLLPGYLRFVKGVVDSADLPLNVSRELLQDNPMIGKIRSNLVKRVLSTLEKMKKKEYDKYVEFFQQFGGTLKEGVSQDFANRDRLAGLILCESTRTEPGKYLTLDDYVEQMGEEQSEILYLCGDDMGVLRSSPYLEACRAKGQDVLLLNEPIDPFFCEGLSEYKEKKLKAVDAGSSDDESEIPEATTKAFSGLLEKLDGIFDELKSVRLSTRLKESAACLVAGNDHMNAQMERIMRQMSGGDAPVMERILELNPEHPAVQHMLALHDANGDSPAVELLGRVFYDQALVAEGSRIKDPTAFAKRINELATAFAS
jgi:molecular chaperone HtpG